MTTRLDISIGPVQGFVSQSRRTRDLWGSSYLLAFLSAHGMHGVTKAGATVVQPDLDGDRLYRWVAGHGTGEPPRFGTLPNHFVAKVNGDARGVAEAAVESITAAWTRAHDAVWNRYVAHACPVGNDTEAIWRRQVGAFWEVMWTAAPWDDHGRSFSRRKRWRSHSPPAEPGDKCTVMHDLQELSGHVRAQHRGAQDQFWNVLRNDVGSLDLRDNERLCAIALVKRLLPKIALKALGWEVDASRWPSTVFVGAVPWMQRVMSAVPRRAAAYADAVGQYAPPGVRAVQRPRRGLAVPAAGDFPKLDANYLHREFVSSDRLCPLDGDTESRARKELAEQLQVIYDAEDQNGRLGPPPTFYALLLADGDRLGRLLGELGGETVSTALRAFTGSVPRVVERHDGVTVYAGGDDVLALLPIPRALACAQALSDAYRGAFTDAAANTAAKDEATLSAAVVFAHIRLPLNHVLGEAHRLLDDVAKDGNGRDSLVAAVLKPGGPYCQWATIWTRPGPEGAVRATDQLDALRRQLDANTVEPGLSSALVYRVRETLTRLCGWEQWRPGDWGSLPNDIDVRALLGAEIHHSLDVRMDGGAEDRADTLTERVWNLLGRARNPRTDAGVTGPDEAGSAIAQVGVDALLLVRFLADPQQGESDR